VSRRSIRCPKCGNPSTDGTIYLLVPGIECAPVTGLAGSVVKVEGPMTRRPIPEATRLECWRMDEGGRLCGHRFVPDMGLAALVWRPEDA